MRYAVIYARVSTVRQADEGVSMDSQIEQCHVKAKALGVEVAQVFRDDGVSGRTDARPGFQAALAYCAAHPVKHFICWSTSRFGRNLEDALKNASLLREWGTKPAYVHQDIDLETDGGWMLGVMTGMMDEMHSRTVSRDTLRSMISASRDGWWVGGRPPFGYVSQVIGKRRKLVPHEVDADIVRTMFGIALNEGLGAQAVATRMNEAGLTRAGRPWGKTTVTQILKNPSYMGCRMFNQVGRKTREAKPKDEVVQVASHPALVDRADFERLQAMMTERTPHAQLGGTPRSMFAFTGLMQCGICGEPMQMTNGTGRGKVVYNYYRCLGHRQGKVRCIMKPVRAEAFDQWMLDQLLEKVLTAEVVQRVIDDIRINGGNWAAEREVRRKALVAELRDVEGRRGKLYDVLETQGKDTPALGDLTERLRALHEAVERITGELRRLEAMPAPDYSNVELNAQDAADTIRQVIRECGDSKKLRELLGTFVQQLTITTELVRVEYREEALLRRPATVHSGLYWLPVGASLRTNCIEILRPEVWPGLRLLAA